MIEVKHLEKYYGSDGTVTKALDDISFISCDGEFLCIMGASGSGKSTLLNCLSTIDCASAGDILFNGVSFDSLKKSELAAFRRHNLGFIFQNYNLLDTLTLGENISLSLLINGAAQGTIQKRIHDIANQVGIGHLLDIPSADVSLYIWALDYLFFNLLTWGTLLFLGFVFNCVPRCLLFLILYLPLRIYAGGFHAKTKIGCYLISAFTFLFVVLYPADTTIHFYHLVFPCISTCIIYYFSPVSATNKPLDDLEALHYKKMARKILFSEILFFLLILLIFNTQITFAFFFSFTIHLSVLALQITVELVSKNFFANL